MPQPRKGPFDNPAFRLHDTPLPQARHDMEDQVGCCRKVAFLGMCPLFSPPVEIGGGDMSDCKGSQFEKDIMLWGMRWYVAYTLSSR